MKMQQSYELQCALDFVVARSLARSSRRHQAAIRVNPTHPARCVAPRPPRHAALPSQAAFDRRAPFQLSRTPPFSGACQIGLCLADCARARTPHANSLFVPPSAGLAVGSKCRQKDRERPSASCELRLPVLLAGKTRRPAPTPRASPTRRSTRRFAR